jgi:hypothetical protein
VYFKIGTFQLRWNGTDKSHKRCKRNIWSSSHPKSQKKVDLFSDILEKKTTCLIRCQMYIFIWYTEEKSRKWLGINERVENAECRLNRKKRVTILHHDLILKKISTPHLHT